MASEYANTDLMGAYAGLGEDLSLGLEGLRIGDVVAWPTRTTGSGAATGRAGPASA